MGIFQKPSSLSLHSCFHQHSGSMLDAEKDCDLVLARFSHLHCSLADCSIARLEPGTEALASIAWTTFSLNTYASENISAPPFWAGAEDLPWRCPNLSLSRLLPFSACRFVPLRVTASILSIRRISPCEYPLITSSSSDPVNLTSRRERTNQD